MPGQGAHRTKGALRELGRGGGTPDCCQVLGPGDSLTDGSSVLVRGALVWIRFAFVRVHLFVGVPNPRMAEEMGRKLSNFPLVVGELVGPDPSGSGFSMRRDAERRCGGAHP